MRPSPSTFYNAFDLLRFPLALGVIVLHCNLIDSDGADVEAFTIPFGILHRYIFGLCVPVFFAISGFMFFREGPDLSVVEYVGKLRSRARTLLLPYLLWNMIALGVLYLKSWLMPGAESQHSVRDLSFAQVLMGFIATDSGNFPWDFPLWFIRSLMVVCLLTPVVSFLLKTIKAFTPLAFWVIYMFTCGLDGLIFKLGIFTGLFYFSLGAAISTYGKECISRLNTVTILSAFLLAVVAMLVLFDSDFWGQMMPANKFREALWFAIFGLGVIVVLKIALDFSESGVVASKMLTSTTFFLFAFHGLFCSMVRKIVIDVIPPVTSLTCWTDFLIIFTIVTAVSLCAYAVMRLAAPRLLSVLSGGR